jgi:hypothetical protein
MTHTGGAVNVFQNWKNAQKDSGRAAARRADHAQRKAPSQEAQPINNPQSCPVARNSGPHYRTKRPRDRAEPQGPPTPTPSRELSPPHWPPWQVDEQVRQERSTPNTLRDSGTSLLGGRRWARALNIAAVRTDTHTHTQPTD